jgi:hypothetical protein
MHIQRSMPAALLLVLLSACGEADGPAAPPSVPTAPPADVAAPPTQAPRDLAAIEACTVLPNQEVAEIVGGTLATTESSWTGPHCMYVIDVAGVTEGYVLHFSRADEMAPVVDFLDDAQKGEPVAGPWQEAYLGPKEFGEGLRMIVLDRGDLALEVSGESRRDPIVEIARRAYTRVK